MPRTALPSPADGERTRATQRRCEIDANRYPKGIKVTAAEMAALAIERRPFHGEWNYTISPIQQPP
jgi:hypothetical protein